MMDYSTKFDIQKQSLNDDKTTNQATSHDGSAKEFSTNGAFDNLKNNLSDDELTKQGTLLSDSNRDKASKGAFEKRFFNSVADSTTPVVETKEKTKWPVQSATIQLTTAIMGSGWLNIPKAFGIYGLGLGLILVFAAAINQMIALYLYTELCKAFKNKESYGELMRAVLGKKPAMFLDCMFVLNLFGTLIAYSLVINNLLTNVVERPLASLFDFQDDTNFHKILSISIFMGVILLTMPLQLMTDTKKLSSLGFLSIVTLLFIQVLIGLQTPSYRIENDITSNFKYFDVSNTLVSLQSIGIFTFSIYVFDCLFIIKKGMGKAATQENLMKVGSISVTMMCLPFAAVGLLGYASFGHKVTGLDLFVLRPALSGSTDIAMDIGKILLVGAIILSNISRVVALKTLLFEMTGKQITWKRNVIFTTSFMFIPALIAFVYPDVNDWVSLQGSLCMASLGFLFPGLMGIKMYCGKGNKLAVILIAIWCSIMVTISYASAFVTICKMIGVLHPEIN